MYVRTLGAVFSISIMFAASLAERAAGQANPLRDQLLGT
jgi:hypothetical protein